jgi:hypothetical protein
MPHLLLLDLESLEDFLEAGLGESLEAFLAGLEESLNAFFTGSFAG